MSLQKQIRKNIAKENNKLLSQYGKQLVPNWQGRSESEKNILAQIARNGITIEDLKAEWKRGRDYAFEKTAPIVQKACYAAIAIVLAEDYGFSPDECQKVIMKADEKTGLVIDTEELFQEMREKAKIDFYANEGVERVSQVE